MSVVYVMLDVMECMDDKVKDTMKGMHDGMSVFDGSDVEKSVVKDMKRKFGFRGISEK